MPSQLKSFIHRFFALVAFGDDSMISEPYKPPGIEKYSDFIDCISGHYAMEMCVWVWKECSMIGNPSYIKYKLTKSMSPHLFHIIQVFTRQGYCKSVKPCFNSVKSMWGIGSSSLDH